MSDLNMNPITPLNRFWKLISYDKKEIRNLYVYSIFNGLINLSLPLGIQAIINLIQGGQVSTSWILLVIFVVLGVLFTGILQVYQLRISENLQQKIFTRAAFDFAFRIPRIKMEKLYRHYAPELMNRFFDIINVQKGLSKILIEFSTSALHILFGLILLSLYHPFFIIFSLILILIIYAIFGLTMKKGLQTSLKESKYKYMVAHWLEEIARNNMTFKLAGKTDLPLKRTDQYVNNYVKARESHFKILVQQYSLMVMFKVIVATGLLAIGGVLVMEQRMNIGQFVAAEIIILLVMASVEKLILSLETIYDVLTALEKVGQVTDLEIDKSTGVKFNEFVHEPGIELEFNDVNFNYSDSSQYIVSGISLNIQAGENVTVTGSNGSGKSTLLQLMAGLYDIHHGTISYNGLPKGNLNISSLHSVIGDCFTYEQLFRGTVLENISMGREGATFENIRWAVENLGLAQFIKSLPKGFDSMINPEGKGLPRNVIIKLLLARSIADKPKLLLLEDVFENMSKTEKVHIVDFLSQKEHGWTMVVITRDAYAAKKSDRILWMENGTITQEGSYEEMKSFIDFKSTDHA
jgi:ABC-type bacteriocin/lantibiotic exporter with double-glycine peptidase domain